MSDSVLNKVDRTIDKKRPVKKASEEELRFGKYVDVYRRLLLLNEKNSLETTLKNIQELLSFSEKVFSSSSVAETFLYFCLHGAATAWVLQAELSLPEATTYRALKRLRALRIVVPALKARKLKSSKGGPKPTVWSLEGASPEEVAAALKLHYRMLSPKYRAAEEVAQSILDDYVAKRKVDEISYREIIVQIKELRLPYRAPDIADLAAQYLHEKGVKVWR